jgi:hypothetical protein
VDHKLYYRNVVRISILCLLITGLVVVPVQAGWSTHMVQQVNGFDILAESQLPTVEIGWNQMPGENHLVYMPSQGPQGRMLISIHEYSGPPATVGLYSDDFGTTWSQMTLPAMSGLTYFGETPLGNGKVMVSAGDRWLSNNYGEPGSWQVVGTTPHTIPTGEQFYMWDPIMVDKNASGYVTRLAEGGYTVTDQTNEFGAISQGHIRFSMDEGYSFPQLVTPPEWLGVSEVALTRAGNGDIVAACRTNITTTPDPLTHADFYSGLGTSISQDNGLTWSPVNKLYEYGRHHSSTALMPNGDLVMSYVVRAGYGRDPGNGRERFGIEAVVSHDNGQTWDMDNRYILDQWTSTQDGTDGWMSSPGSTSTVVLPDGSLLTEYGTGERVVAGTVPRDVKVVHWSTGETVGANYIFRETSPGTWEVSIEVSGDGSTVGLSAYEIWVDGVDSSLVSFTENVLGTVVGVEYTPVGFASLLQGDVGGSFNAGNYQGSGDSAILGIGMVDIDEPGSLPGTTPHVDLGVPALLGILSTPEGLDEANFRAISVGLFNAVGDGFLNNDLIIPTYEVIPFTFLLGDANGDGVVSAGDYAAVQANFGNTGATGGGLLGDANGDGVVSAGDYASVQANFGNTSASMNPIPEPATMMLLLAGGVLGVVRKRK